MTLRIKLIDPEFVLVTVEVQGQDGPAEEAALPTDAVPVVPTLRLKCRHKGPNALAEWLHSFDRRSTVDALAEVLVDFGGSLADEAGRPVGASRQVIAAVLDQVKPAEGASLFGAVVDAYIRALSEGAAKN